MKSKINLLVMAAVVAGAAVMHSCNDDEPQQVYDEPVNFSTSIDQVATPPGSTGTRATETNWTSNDKIGIYMVENKTTTVSMEAANKQYITTADLGIGQFKAVIGNEIYYPTIGNVDFIAYYPWKATGSGGIENDLYSVDVSNQSNLEKIDLLWAHATGTEKGGYDKYNDQSVKLEFSHKLTRLILKTIPGVNTGFTTTDLEGMDISIKGMNTKNTFNVKTAAFGTSGSSADITPFTVIDGVHYEAIILEHEVENLGDVSVVFTINDSPFTWKVPAGTKFNSGEEHEWEITIHRLGVSVIGSIKPWNTGKGGTGVAD